MEMEALMDFGLLTLISKALSWVADPLTLSR